MKTFHNMLIDALPRLRAYARLMTRDRATADDILQEAATRALAAQHQFQVGTNFNAWMYRIVRNEFMNICRKAKPGDISTDSLTYELPAHNPTPEDAILLRQLGRAMKHLPRTQEEALILVCAQGLSYAEVADIQQCTLGTAKSRVFRARQYLAGVIAYDGNVAASLELIPKRQARSIRALEAEASMLAPIALVAHKYVHATASAA